MGGFASTSKGDRTHATIWCDKHRGSVALLLYQIIRSLSRGYLRFFLVRAPIIWVTRLLKQELLQTSWSGSLRVKDLPHCRHFGISQPPILNTLVPHFGQVPDVAARPFFIVTLTGFFIATFALHLTQYAVTPVAIQFTSLDSVS